jgi:hypothetical protein
MNAFLRRFLMHYGIYRRYPLGRLPTLRNACRADQQNVRLGEFNIIVLGLVMEARVLISP